MNIQLLIATFNQRINRVEQMLLPPMEGLSYLISHQIDTETSPVVPQSLNREDVLVHIVRGIGLSANRNNAMEQAKAEIVVLLDDDVRLKPEYIQKLQSIFESNPKVDVVCTKIKTPDGEPEYKAYPHTARKYTTIAQLKSVSSIEISFRLKKVRENGICFDERFGLGATFKSGEELIFLNDCLRKGLVIHFFPEYTVEHPFQSSAKSESPFCDERLQATGAQSYLLYGKKAYLRNILAVLRRYCDLHKEGISPMHFIRMKQQGSLSVGKKPKVVKPFFSDSEQNNTDS